MRGRRDVMKLRGRILKIGCGRAKVTSDKVLLLHILAADICGSLFGASILFGLVLALGVL